MLDHQLSDVAKEFQNLADKQLPKVNAALKAKKIGPIEVLSEQEWEKPRLETGSANAAAAMQAHMRDNDETSVPFACRL